MQAAMEEALSALQEAPQDVGLREDAARALCDAGRHGEAVTLLLEAFINVAAHDGPVLPCLCKRCLDPKRARAEEGGVAFRREFVVAKGRVLFFWMPESLQDRAAVRRSVRVALESRLDRRP